MKTIYLDTSDFSYLADIGTRRNETSDIETLDRAIHLAASHSVRFVFSFTNIFEIFEGKF